MYVLDGKEKEQALMYIDEAIRVAHSATCERSLCGSVIVSDDLIIGRGFNSPPGDVATQKRCSCSKDSYHKKVTDKTCCIHAEQRAIFDALKHHADKIKGSRLYFVRLNAQGNMSYSGNPYCTICSKSALDQGISEFVLYHKEGITVYDTVEYNDLSFLYQG